MQEIAVYTLGYLMPILINLLISQWIIRQCVDSYFHYHPNLVSGLPSKPRNNDPCRCPEVTTKFFSRFDAADREIAANYFANFTPEDMQKMSTLMTSLQTNLTLPNIAA
jgi:hypothetical protein